MFAYERNVYLHTRFSTGRIFDGLKNLTRNFVHAEQLNISALFTRKCRFPVQRFSLSRSSHLAVQIFHRTGQKFNLDVSVQIFEWIGVQIFVQLAWTEHTNVRVFDLKIRPVPCERSLSRQSDRLSQSPSLLLGSGSRPRAPGSRSLCHQKHKKFLARALRSRKILSSTCGQV